MADSLVGNKGYRLIVFKTLVYGLEKTYVRMNKTRSLLFDSVQQSPIDSLMMDVTEGPLTPPLETVQEVKLPSVNPQVWIDQLGSYTLCGANGVSVVANKRGESLHAEKMKVYQSISVQMGLKYFTIDNSSNCQMFNDKSSGMTPTVEAVR